MDDLLARSQLTVPTADIKAWYNGYQIGETILYNPWSITHCLKKWGKLKPYWVNTSGNDLIHHTIAHADEDFRDQLESFLVKLLLKISIKLKKKKVILLPLLQNLKPLH
jgi:hypothetical protein